jgi:Tfp pilus assembly protein FimT
MKFQLTLLILMLTVISISCQREKKKDLDLDTPVTVEESADDNVETTDTSSSQEQAVYAPQSTNEQTAANLKNFLKSYTASDYELLTENDKRFQFYEVDLNDDGNKEIFVRFMGPYFCGSGGCTFLLLDKYAEVITRFTVTRAPIYIEQEKRNGWSFLLVKDSGVFKELVYENGSYPTNPSVLPKAPYDAPSGHAEIMFDETFAKCKTFNF